MNITWIIGNGFDKNLGLEVGYDDFLENLYFQDDYLSAEQIDQRNRLVEIVKENPLSEEKELWSDFEKLLGEATSGYSINDESFHETFEGIQELIVRYVCSEEARLPRNFLAETEPEFWSSICRLYDRMVTVDKNKQVSTKNINSAIVYHFISLNYTDVLDRMVRNSRKMHNPFDKHTNARGTNYGDSIEEPLHLHGVINNKKKPEEDGPEIVFGVSSPEQIANKEFAQDSDFQDMWIKEKKNGTLYGNQKTSEMRKLIGNSSVICIYGCSLGESDSYIWKEIGSKLKKDQNTNLILFDRDLPDRKSLNGRAYQQKSFEVRRKFISSTGLSEEEGEQIKDRIFLLPSTTVFKFSIELSPNEKYKHSSESKIAADKGLS